MLIGSVMLFFVGFLYFVVGMLSVAQKTDNLLTAIGFFLMALFVHYFKVTKS